ncbi:NAD(P)/FAD-dependent oxidoreductase [Novosphingopyxis sp. YJ-S2-01]|uniref:NAD(P)/FAD-dependent oxidoreductase n=1 Tax=Novosphingopyxis sp. YJ-S2-01 TaxID=2794021 RepID=UPI0018DCB2C0|nr:NAD(P)/FAD-dependent oxidoreductase [Novosphingopyxis sp. YJ-S2-01]
MTDHMGYGADGTPHRVVVVGAGFGGLNFVASAKMAGLEITLIDRQNHHLFQPLLYQAAITVLPVTDIAWPIRTLMRDRPDVRVVQAEVCDVDLEAREVRTHPEGSYPYDTLILSPGSVTSYFGNDEWAAMAPGLKTASDAMAIRTRILAAFEQCEREASGRAPCISIIGGGPTGVELAGMIATLCQKELKDEFRSFNPSDSTIVLIDAADRLLPNLPDDLSAYGAARLRKMGIELRLGEKVTGCHDGGVSLESGDLACDTVIWAAGTRAVPVAKWLGVEAERGGRVPVSRDLSLPGHGDVFVIGDCAEVEWKDGKSVPGIAPAAKQQGAYLAGLLRHRLGKGRDPGPFVYRHQGDLATIGPNQAAVDFGWIKLTGRLAWWLWGLAHIYFLIGVRSRIAVLLHWFWLRLLDRSDARLALAAHDDAGAVPGEDEDENDGQDRS